MEPLLADDLDASTSVNLDIQDNTQLNDIYLYYYFGGFHTVLTNNIVRLTISYILIFIINFLTNCVDYQGILNDMEEPHTKNISTFIRMDKWFPTNGYFVICFIMYCIYLFCITINTYYRTKNTYKIRNYYKNELDIGDSSLKYYTWDRIHQKILDKHQENFQYHRNTIYKTSTRICHNSNIIISIFRSKFFTLPNFSKLLEWNFIYCIIDPINTCIKQVQHDNNQWNESNNTFNSLANTFLNEDTSYRPVQTDNSYGVQPKNEMTYQNEMMNNNADTTFPMRPTIHASFKDTTKDPSFIQPKLLIDYPHLYQLYLSKVNARLNLVMVINIIALPFAIIILGIYLILKYGEKFYHNPKLIYQRQLNIKTKWKLRYYNEFPHLFDERIKQIQYNMDTIIEQYESTIFQIIYRLFVFIGGSIFIILFSLTLISGNEFANIILFDNRSILWFLSILGTFLIVARNNTRHTYVTKEKKMKIFDILKRDLLSIDRHILDDEKDKEKIISLIKEIYPYKVKFIVYEILYLMASPYFLYQWKKQINRHYNELFKLLESDIDLGAVSIYSVFENVNAVQKNLHMYLSIKNFMESFEYKFDNMLNKYDDTDLSISKLKLIETRI